tara:strand:+ start:357 stop:1328 length:972 start_codon:yes stop_codon:yes gene_type:complete
MNTQAIKQRTLSIKTSFFYKLASFILAVIYGIFIVISLQIQFYLGSGDINSYIHFFDEAGNDSSVVSIRGDYAFRIATFFLTEFFDVTTISVLSSMAFVIAAVVFYLFTTSIKSQKTFIYILPLFLMVFFTPNVQVLFSSGIRSGIAFAILMMGFLSTKSFYRYLLFILSVAVHLSMLPILSLYVLFKFLNNTRIRTPFTFSLLILVLASFVISFGSTQVHFVDIVSASAAYNFIIFYVALLIIFINKKALKDIYGFMSVGLILIYLAGLVIDASFIRYVGNSILLYLLFLIRRGEGGTIQVFSIGYSPFFLLTLYYSISNWF